MNKTDMLEIEIDLVKRQREVLLEMFKTYKEEGEVLPVGQICTGIQITFLDKVIDKLKEDLIKQLEIEVSSQTT